jgi:hypothetical protein
MDTASSPQQQFISHDNPRRDQKGAELAYERPVNHRVSGRLYEGYTDGPTTSAGSGLTNPQVSPETEIVETRTAGGQTQEPGKPHGISGGGGGAGLEWPRWTEGAGYLQLTDEQRAILQAPFDDNDITIRYDGIVYAPWRKYWGRMVKAFAPYVPSIIPIDSPRFQGQEIIVGVVMVVAGKFVGKAWGSHRLEGANDRMAVGDRIESAISDAVSKIGKRLDMGEQLWDDQYRDYWKSQFAESYTSRGRTYWRRKAVVAAETDDDQLPDF